MADNKDSTEESCLTFVVTKINGNEKPVFWTGKLTPFTRQAVKTRDVTLAKKFDTASEAYTACLTRPELQRWRVRPLAVADGEAKP